MSGRDNPFDMQIKILMIGDSGKWRDILLHKSKAEPMQQNFVVVHSIIFYFHSFAFL
jgi:hypothetical protein